MRVLTAPVGNEHAGRADESVLAWRELRFLQMGVPTLLAGRLARDRRVDLHEFERMLARGCDPELAAAILAE